MLRLIAFFAALFIAAWCGWNAYVTYAPDEYDVTAPLDLTLKPTFVTLWKLESASAETCFGALERANVSFTRLPDEEKGEGCFLENVATLDQSLVSWGGGVSLTCPMLARLLLWERHSLLPAADTHLGAEIVRISHFGTYACRNVNNSETGRRSEHARAAAIDFAGVQLENGESVTVDQDYDSADEKGAFLEEIKDGACALFPTVLGPDYNAAHRNHFHFDDGRFSICR